ncbi:MAG: sterol desaturase family protein [bacterium]|nr:sterol desaturase family protein [bacterium]
MIGIPLGLLYGNAAEWILHKYVLHGMGKNKKSMWRFHWHAHHKNARTKDMIDEEYFKPFMKSGHPKKELVGLLVLASTHLPLLPVFPFFTLTSYYCAYNYYRVHKKSHMDIKWCKKNVPWHYDHHMAPNQDANWCVTRPWFDNIMKTREPYLGTVIEKTKQQKLRKKSQTASAKVGTKVLVSAAALS